MQFPSISSIDSGSDSEDGDLQLFLPSAYQPGRLVSIQDFERLLEHEVTISSVPKSTEYEAFDGHETAQQQSSVISGQHSKTFPTQCTDEGAERVPVPMQKSNVCPAGCWITKQLSSDTSAANADRGSNDVVGESPTPIEANCCSIDQQKGDTDCVTIGTVSQLPLDRMAPSKASSSVVEALAEQPGVSTKPECASINSSNNSRTTAGSGAAGRLCVSGSAAAAVPSLLSPANLPSSSDLDDLIGRLSRQQQLKTAVGSCGSMAAAAAAAGPSPGASTAAIMSSHTPQHHMEHIGQELLQQLKDECQPTRASQQQQACSPASGTAPANTSRSKASVQHHHSSWQADAAPIGSSKHSTVKLWVERRVITLDLRATTVGGSAAVDISPAQAGSITGAGEGFGLFSPHQGKCRDSRAAPAAASAGQGCHLGCASPVSGDSESEDDSSEDEWQMLRQRVLHQGYPAVMCPGGMTGAG